MNIAERENAGPIKTSVGLHIIVSEKQTEIQYQILILLD